MQALVATTQPVALWCPVACKFVPPAHADGSEAFVDVRLFRIEGGDGEVVMDSLGLHAFARPDIQCRFEGVDPGEMAVPGPRGDERWRCRHGAALIGPDRVVVDIVSDAPAGGRRPWPRRGR